jgi:hypothetical protein
MSGTQPEVGAVFGLPSDPLSNGEDRPPREVRGIRRSRAARNTVTDACIAMVSGAKMREFLRREVWRLWRSNNRLDIVAGGVAVEEERDVRLVKVREPVFTPIVATS